MLYWSWVCTKVVQLYICACMLSHFSCVWLFATQWTIGPPRLLCPYDYLWKNTGVGCQLLLQGIFPIQRSNPCSSIASDSLSLNHLGSPYIYMYLFFFGFFSHLGYLWILIGTLSGFYIFFSFIITYFRIFFKNKNCRGRSKREGIYVYLQLIHVDVWQKPPQYCKATILHFSSVQFSLSVMSDSL